MTVFAEIVLAALAGGVLATLAAAGTLALHRVWISRLVSFAVGALLGAVFLELLPHALEQGGAERVMVTVLCGLLAFFLLEKLVLWRPRLSASRTQKTSIQRFLPMIDLPTRTSR